MRILFVGQAPSRETEGQPPFTGKCGRFLAELLDTTQEQMLKDHDFINVLDHYPGKSIVGDKFPMVEATLAAQKKLDLLRGRVVVLLGSNVAKAFMRKLHWQYLSWYELRDDKNAASVLANITVVPHPSGVNRYWNDSMKREIASKFLRTLAAKE